jgi:hypothetical protein
MDSTNVPGSSDSSPGAPRAGHDDTYVDAVRRSAGDPELLEQLYQGARGSGESRVFAAAIATVRQESPANLLYGAWYYRLRQPIADAQPGRLGATWRWVVPISILLGAAFWLLSDPSLKLADNIPLLALLAAPLTGLALVIFLAGAGHRGYLNAQVAGVVLLGLIGYVLGVASMAGTTGLTRILLHVPLLAWGAIGLAALGWRSAARERFAFLTKSIEAIGTGGDFAIAGGIFAVIAIGMFTALSVALPDPLMRLLVAVVAGLVPLFAIAAIYDPAAGPLQQEFGRGFGRILTVIMRVLLVLSLVVLVIYVAVIPFNFMAPFQNRDVLIVYNVMLFGIMGLLIGVTPLSTEELTPRLGGWLRAGIVAVAALVALVSLYALAAVLYRTIGDGDLTMNRATIIGWNVINIAILLALLIGQVRAGRGRWAEAVQRAIAGGAIAYVAWAAFVALALPWLL